MDCSVFYGPITEQELEKHLQTRIEKLQTLKERGLLKPELLRKDFDTVLDEMLNSVAYKYVTSEGLSKEAVTDEIKNIMANISKINLSYDEEESFDLDDFSSSGTSNCSLSTKSESFSEFNDTLEEMELALNEGLDYKFVKKEESHKMKSTFKKDCDCVDKENYNTNNENSVEFKKDKTEIEDVSQMIEHFSCDVLDTYENKNSSSSFSEAHSEYKKKETETSNYSVHNTVQKLKDNTYKTSPTNVKKNNYVRNTKFPDFKIPVTPVSKLYRDVVSPVALYIKNSSKVPLQRNINHLNKQGSTLLFNDTNRFSFAKDIKLHNVYYEPAQNKVISTERKMKLPNSINSLIGKRPEIIVHETRIKKGHRRCTSEKLAEVDVRDITLSNEDTSVLMSKEAIIR